MQGGSHMPLFLPCCGSSCRVQTCAILRIMETRVNRYGTTRHSGSALRWPFITAGLLLIGITAANVIVGNANLGTYLPAILGLPVALYGFFRPKLDVFFSHGIGRAVKWIAAGAYIAVIAVVCICSAAIAAAAAHVPPAGADAVVVLGAAVHGSEVTDTLEKRLDAAIGYYTDNPGALIVVTGGMGSGETVSEAEAMRAYLVRRGVPADAILVEDQAQDTRENFRFSYNLLEQRFGRPVSIVYVTSDFHILRAGAEAKKAGFDEAYGLGAPTPILTVPGAWLRESGALVRGLLRGDFAES